MVSWGMLPKRCNNVIIGIRIKRSYTCYSLPARSSFLAASWGVRDEEVLEAILGHASYTGTPRRTRMAKALFAVDELTGLITAAVYVRPDRSILGLELPSLKKKFKDKAFAKGVNREEIRLGAEELGVPLEEHMAFVLEAMKQEARLLGLEGA